ncbi:MAG: molybdenum cofactor biosynthesis protein MoaE [Flavobacteriales bacterium]|nr:molybdenum cofactor biosynthesis protein MoaE [Flavobacteriales bacterium]MBP6643037.1 molybdenum cofactor biosynthesis protein MoaE [Flavobacteriales bacterium]MBP7155004.1 molybdenum cofactor biosynthesis protein MoaE [Flavobacteriales bacterium]HQV74212.1 molybdenum cofactor biosynthesis protein MoaE [Flavobacteriales bacterium]HQW40609.1 molybdenum cofactor biosynthesis protein MoaE [Flavobacteriales bacterium]
MSEVRQHKVKDIFVDGPIDPSFVGTSIAKHATRQDIGAHEIFLGQIRADVVGADDRPPNNVVIAIEYTAYREMALETMTAIREEAFVRWPEMTCLHVHHSLGTIPVGQLCFMVFASSKHRQQAREAVAYVVDRIKSELPIFGKEIFVDNTHQWKRNT